eukprot:290239-Amphidinium_carterae.1
MPTIECGLAIVMIIVATVFYWYPFGGVGVSGRPKGCMAAKRVLKHLAGKLRPGCLDAFAAEGLTDCLAE